MHYKTQTGFDIYKQEYILCMKGILGLSVGCECKSSTVFECKTALTRVLTVSINRATLSSTLSKGGSSYMYMNGILCHSEPYSELYIASAAYIYLWVTACQVETESLWSVIIAPKHAREYVRLVLKTWASLPNHFKRFVSDTVTFVIVVHSGKEEGIKSHLQTRKQDNSKALCLVHVCLNYATMHMHTCICIVKPL